MNRIVKQALIAVALFGVCAAVLKATKSYGIWVISGIAVVLFCIGMLRKEEPAKAPEEKGQKTSAPADPMEPTKKKENP